MCSLAMYLIPTVITLNYRCQKAVSVSGVYPRVSFYYKYLCWIIKVHKLNKVHNNEYSYCLLPYYLLATVSANWAKGEKCLESVNNLCEFVACLRY